MSRPAAAGEESWLDRNRDSESPRRNWRDDDKPCTACGENGHKLDGDGLCSDCATDEDEVGL